MKVPVPELCRRFPATLVANCSGTQFGFIPGDKDDRLEVVAYPTMAVIDRTKVMKMTSCCSLTAPVDLFWITFNFLSSGSWSDFLLDIKGSLVEVSVWLDEGLKVANKIFYFLNQNIV